MSRLTVVGRALRGPFAKLLQKLRILIKTPLITRAPQGTLPMAKGGVPSPGTLARQVAQNSGGTVRPNKGGFTVEIPHGRRLIVLRVMERGGSRTNYYRIGVEGKSMYTRSGAVSSRRDLTPIALGESSLADVLAIVAQIKKGS